MPRDISITSAMERPRHTATMVTNGKPAIAASAKGSCAFQNGMTDSSIRGAAVLGM